MRAALILLLAGMLAGCAHKDLRAPCSPPALAYAPTPKAPAPFDQSLNGVADECGPARPVNDGAALAVDEG